MAEFKRIKMNQIFVPERLREVEEGHALAIAQSMVEHGQLNPITVRYAPAMNKGGTPYIILAGAHRYRAVEINEEGEIDAMVVDADQSEGQLVEITENLFRNDLSVLDRAVFVAKYREVWEEKYGKIEPGRPANRSNLVQLISDEAKVGFGQHVADRMGISKSALKYLNQISQNLHADLRAAVRGTPVADNQAALLKFAKLEPKKQRQAAVAFRTENGDLKKALALIDDRPPAVKDDPQKQYLSRLIDTWERADSKSCTEFMAHVERLAA